MPETTPTNDIVDAVPEEFTPSKTTDQVSPVGRPLSVKLTVDPDAAKPAVIVPALLTVALVEGLVDEPKAIEPVADHEANAYPEFAVAETVIEEPELYHPVVEGVTIPPVLGLALNDTWYWVR